MFQFKRFSIGLSVLVLTTAGVAGCTAKGSQQPVGGTTPVANQTENRATVPQNSVANGISTNATGVQNTTTPSGTSTTTSTTAAPMEIDALPGGMLSRLSWPLKGTNPHNIGTGMFEANYTTSGCTIGGVHWTWPASDVNPKHYVVVPTTILGKPYLVWCHLAPQKMLGKPENGSAGYGPNQIEPIGPSQMWRTPWSIKGGSLSNRATLITDNIPPVFSTSGQYAFPANSKDIRPQSLAGSAWTGWFQWGNAASRNMVAPAKPPVEPTVAVPNGLYPAYNGVVLTVQTQVLQANQGGAINLYYLDLANHKIVGLASLMNGGGLFYGMRVVSGMVFTGSATDLTSNAQIQAVAYVYNEVTGKRTSVSSSAVMSQNNGFNDWSIQGGKIYDASNKLQAELKLPASVTLEPSAFTFGVSNQNQ